MESIKLFSIGDVAKLFHISVSSLRYYEKIGLLMPEKVMPKPATAITAPGSLRC